MAWLNLDALLELLNRRGIPWHKVTVYWDGRVDAGVRHLPPPYPESVSESEGDEDQLYEDEED